MVTRKRLRSILTTLGFYVMAALLIGYFGVNAYSGNHGLKAKEDLDQQIATLSADLDRLKPERAQWERRVALLRADKLDPDMLDEQARSLLDYVAPKIIFAGNALAGFARPVRQVARFRNRAFSAMGCKPRVSRTRMAVAKTKPAEERAHE